MLAVLSTLNPEHALFAKSYRPPRPERVAAAQLIQDDHGFFEGLPTAKNASKRKASRVTFVDTQTANRLRRKELEKRAAAIEKQLKLHRAHDEQHRLGGRHVYEDEDEEEVKETPMHDPNGANVIVNADPVEEISLAMNSVSMIPQGEPVPAIHSSLSRTQQRKRNAQRARDSRANEEMT